MAAARKPKAPTKPALTPDELITTSKANRIRLIEKRPPRRKKRPAAVRPGAT